jgi:hypothetical protein
MKLKLEKIKFSNNILTTFSVCLVFAFSACSNDSSNNKSQNTASKDSKNTVIANSSASDLVGTWRPIGLDVNLDGKTEPSGKWEIQDPKVRAQEIKDAGLTEDYGDFTFRADGTGFVGGTVSNNNTFTYKKMANGRYEMKGDKEDNEPKNTNAENIEELYLDKTGQLIFHHTTKQTLLGKSVIQNSFELYKKQ